MKKLTDYLWKQWPFYLLGFGCMFAAISLSMISPQITRAIVNEVFVDGKMERLLPLLAMILVCGLLKSIFAYGKELTFDRTGSTIGTNIRRDLFAHIQKQTVDFFDRTNTGELMARVQDDVDRISGATGYIGMLVAEVVVHVCSVLYCMFHLNWRLTFLPLACMGFCGAVALILERKLDKVYEDISEENATLTTIAEENLSGVRTVKAFAREKFEIEKFLSHSKKYYDLNMKQSKVLIRYYPIFQFVGAALPIAATILGGMEVLNNRMDIGTLLAYVEYTRDCIWPMQMIGWLSNDFSATFASLKKIKKISEASPSLTEAENPEALPEVLGRIEFCDVCFGIDGKEILNRVSFVVPQGKTVGIMGATGSGKTTLVNLLQRFYDPTEGKILLDGKDLKTLSFAQVRRSSAVVMQDVFLFSDTIAENVRMGKKEEIDLPRIKEAARFAQASEFIEKLEETYDTVIGERGVGLSGGQKQRLSIARAVAANAPILVFDDATSALDTETEHKVQEEIEKLEGKTKLIIAHRISAVRHADEILYLDNGRIAERGTHEQLLAAKGLYYETYQVQYGEVI